MQYILLRVNTVTELVAEGPAPQLGCDGVDHGPDLIVIASDR
jgi:hypothetical protein